METCLGGVPFLGRSKLDAAVADKDSVDNRRFVGLHLNTSQVDQFGIPRPLGGIDYATGANASFDNTLDVTRQQVIGRFQDFVPQPGTSDFAVLLNPGTTANGIGFHRRGTEK